MNVNIKKVPDKKPVNIIDKPINKRAKYTDYDLTSQLKFSQLEHSINLHELSKLKNKKGNNNTTPLITGSNSSSTNNGSNCNDTYSKDNTTTSSKSLGSSNNFSDGSGGDKQSMPLTESNLALNDQLGHCAKQRRR